MKKLLAALLVLFVALPSAALPNIVFVLLDDQGLDKTCVYDPGGGGAWNTCGHTPTLDALATSGIRFNHFYVNANCSPTRASFLTGTNSFRHGVGEQIDVAGTGPNQNKEGLLTTAQNLPRALAAAGYRTVEIGKHHLVSIATDSNITTHPLRLGFGHFAGLMGQADESNIIGGVSSYSTYEWCIDGTCARRSDSYLTTAETDEAISQLSGSQPFFLDVNYNAPHSPYHCPPSSLHSYGSCGSGDTRLQYLAMVEAADHELARLIASINFTNTILIVTADNGTPQAIVALDPGPFNSFHAKGSVYDGGVHTPLFIRGTGVAAGTPSNALVQISDLSATILALAGTSSPAFTDGISIVPLLSAPSGNTIRTTAFVQRFLPNSHPAAPNAAIRHDRSVYACATPACTGSVFHLLKLADANYEMYDVSTDIVEATSLFTPSATPDTSGLTGSQLPAYKQLLPAVNFPESSPTGNGHHHSVP